MCRRSLGALLLTLMLLVPAISCTKNPPKRKNQNDPLLMSKTPQQARFGTTADLPPRPEPAPPTMPAGAWVNIPTKATPTGVQLGAPETPGQPGPFRWTSEKRPADSELKRLSLQGSLEKSGNGRWLLAAPSLPGGKVLLEGHPRLDMLDAGESVSVEGYILEDHGPRSSGAWLPYPRFKVEHLTTNK